MKKSVKLSSRSEDFSVSSLPNHPFPGTTAEPEVEEQLMTLHQGALRVRGVLHLLHETLQSNGGLDRKNADAVCALIANTEKDLQAMTSAITVLVDKHLESLRC